MLQQSLLKCEVDVTPSRTALWTLMHCSESDLIWWVLHKRSCTKFPQTGKKRAAMIKIIHLQLLLGVFYTTQSSKIRMGKICFIYVCLINKLKVLHKDTLAKKQPESRKSMSS